MDIIYINIGGSLKITSVYKKIIGQIDGMNSNGLLCRGAFLTTYVKETQPLNKRIDFHPIVKPKSNLFYQLKLKKKYLIAIEDILEKSKADAVYLRYSFCNRRLLRLIKKTNKKFIIERNSKSLNEIIALCKTNGIKPNISSILGSIQDCLVPYLNEKLFASTISKHVALTVGVTQELSEYYQKSPEKRLTLPNGINAQEYPVRDGLAFKRPNKCIILILDGTSTPTPWQGLDRLINSVIEHKLTHQIEIHIAGANTTPHHHSFVKKLGFLEGDDLSNAINKAHIGTGNLCLFRKKLNEGSVLKNREYVARGLPVLYAMDDLDFDKTELSTFAYKVSNTNDTIDLPALLNWLEGLHLEHPDLSEKVHASAVNVLGFSAKMKILKEAIECIEF